MRIYENCYELMSEIMREVWEMGVTVHPHTMQNKNVENDLNFSTKEIINYSYCLQTLEKSEFLAVFDESSLTWRHAEFLERVNPYYVNPGKAWTIRKGIWEEFLNKHGKFDYTYNDRIDPRTRLPHIINELKKNPDTRQAVISIWNPAKDTPYIGNAIRRIPCSIYYQFLLREGKLHIVYNQRSADVVTHFGNDVWLAFSLMRYVAAQIDVKEGYLYHNIASLHCYNKDWEILKTTLTKLKTF